MNPDVGDFVRRCSLQKWKLGTVVDWVIDVSVSDNPKLNGFDDSKIWIINRSLKIVGDAIEKAVRSSWHPSVGAEVCHKRLFELLERMDSLWLKSEVPCSGNFSESNQKSDIEEGIGCSLKKHESLVALKMIERINGAIMWLHLRYLEPTRNRFVENSLFVGGISIIYLELI